MIFVWHVSDGLSTGQGAGNQYLENGADCWVTSKGVECL